MKSVAIIGAGITGLTAAFCLRQRRIPVRVYEASSRVGGVIQSVRRDSYLAEFGPNTILETSPRLVAFIRQAGLKTRKLYSNPAAKNRYIVRDKRLINMPDSLLKFLATPLFTPAAKLRLLIEPLVRAPRDGREESVAEFVLRRLGREFLDHAVDALVAGIYAGDPNKLSVPQAFPKLHALEQRYGSLIKGQIFGAKERRQRGEIPKTEAPKVSFDMGLQVLPEMLHARLGMDVRLNCIVTKLTQQVNGWMVTFRHKDHEMRMEHSAVIYAGTAHGLPGIQFSARQKIDPSPFAKIYYPPVASVVLGFRREDVMHPLDGFGMLIPRVEGFRILGTIFSSSLFPNRAPAGHTTLTSYVGGARAPELALKSEGELYDMSCEDLRVLLGVKGQPTFRHCVLYPKAIPQYELGYGHYRDLMNEIESKAPAFFFAGHYRDGISVGDSILSGINVANRIEQHLASVQRSLTGKPFDFQI
jgi:oxygen-dependent protoporphyrinogen oxidase